VRIGAPLLLPLCPEREKRGSRINPPLTLNEPCRPAVHLGANRTHVLLCISYLVTRIQTHIHLRLLTWVLMIREEVMYLQASDSL
jgi:hypothetical protein